MTTAPSNGSSTSSVDKPSLVHQLQKMQGMEKKRRSRTRRDQLAPIKPGRPYQKSHPLPQTNPLTAQSASPDSSGRSSSRHKDSPRLSRVEESSSRFDSLPPRTSADEHRPLYPSTTAPPQSSSLSSPYYPRAGASLSRGPKNVTPLRASLSIPTPTFNHFQHMAPTTQSTPDSLSPSSPSYREFWGHDHELPGDPRLRYHASPTVPADGPRLATTHLNDNFGTIHSCWNECDRQEGQFGSPIYHRSLMLYPPASSSLVPRLFCRPEQTTITSSFPTVSHSLGTPPAENPRGSHFYLGYKDRAAGASLQSIYPLTDDSSDPDLQTTAPYYS